MQKISIIASFFLFLAYFSCTKDIADPIDTNCVENTNYDDDIRRILDTNCSYESCHDGSGAAPGNYSFYSGVKVTFEGNDEFINRVVSLKDMPPDDAPGPKSLSDEEFEKILCWIESGFPEN